jgi:LPXTG-site transpeptidase (sortase) family protein
VRSPRPSHIVLAAGVGILLLGAGVAVTPPLQSVQWQSSAEAARARRNAAAPTPIWLPPQATVVPTPAAVPPTPTSPPRFSRAVALIANIHPAATPTETATNLELIAASFTFLDPPEPGARARLGVAIRNAGADSAGPVVLELPLKWLTGYRVDTITPSLLSGDQRDNVLRLSFTAPAPDTYVDISVDVVAIDEVIDPPDLVVRDASGREFGRARPATEAPPARPGPVYTVDIPSLQLHAGVVPVEWEPPLFVVGQVRTSAYVSLGNSVLVGHVRGAAGYNVFAHLDQLSLGDEIVASSRGQAYDFVVTRTEVLPEDDTSPTLPSSSPRLTLMTCAGDWDPLTRDYSDRLWVIAEPAGRAASTPRLLALPHRVADR